MHRAALITNLTSFAATETQAGVRSHFATRDDRAGFTFIQNFFSGDDFSLLNGYWIGEERPDNLTIPEYDTSFVPELSTFAIAAPGAIALFPQDQLS
jgi:hypothetical protein